MFPNRDQEDRVSVRDDSVGVYASHLYLPLVPTGLAKLRAFQRGVCQTQS